MTQEFLTTPEIDDGMDIPFTPLTRGGGNFRTMKLTLQDADTAVIGPSLGLRVFGGLFLVVGLAVMIAGQLLTPPADQNPLVMRWALAGFGLIFALAGAWVIFSIKPFVFDRRNGVCWQGRRVDRRGNDVSIPLDNILGLQVLDFVVTNNDGAYTTYELNLVLADPSEKRVNVMRTGNGKKFGQDVDVLAEFLDAPVWADPRKHGTLE